MFLWVRLLADRLNSTKNKKQLNETVRKTPSGFENAFERDLQRILNLTKERDRAIAILRWPQYAQRPLTVRELTEALVVDVNSISKAYLSDNLPDIDWKIIEKQLQGWSHLFRVGKKLRSDISFN